MNKAVTLLMLAGLATMPVLAADQAKTDKAAASAAAGDRAAKQADARAKRMIQQALTTLQDGEEERALGMLEAIPKMFPNSQLRFNAWLELGRAHAAKGRNDEALVVLRKATDSPLTDVKAESYLIQAKVQLAAARDSEASMLLRRITTDFPDSLFANDAWFEIGQIHFKAKRWVRAQEAFRRVGTAVPKPVEKTVGEDVDQTDATPKRVTVNAPVTAEAGQRLYVCVDDRDIAVSAALGKKMKAVAKAASGDYETLELAPFGTDGISALASVPTTSSPSKPEDGVLTVQGGEVVSVVYVDEASADGTKDVALTAPVKIVSSAVLAVMDGAYRQTVKGVFAGNPAFLRLRDLDLDVSPNPDKVKVSVTSYRKRPKPTADEIAEAAAKGEPIDENADPWIEITSAEVTLTETAARSGVFEGRITPMLNGSEATDGQIAAEADGKLVFSYTDQLHLDGTIPRDVETEVAILTGGSTEPQSIVSSASDPVLQSRKLLVEARLLNQWATIFKEVGLDAQATAKADEGLNRVAEIVELADRQAIQRDVMENAYAAKWDLMLVKGSVNEASAVCRELLKAYPDTVLADVAFMRIAKAKSESRDPKEVDEAARIYRSVLSMPNSPNKAEAQYLLAGILEKAAKLRSTADRPPDYTAAIAAYRACAENYPQSSFAGESFKRVVTYQIEKKDYDRAVETLERVFQDYPDAPWLDEMLLRWGIVCYRKGDVQGATAKFRRVLEEYPSGSAAGQATSFLQRLQK